MAKKNTVGKIDPNKEVRITVRYTESDMEYLRAISWLMGMDTSSFIRSLSMSAISAMKIKEKNGEFNLEDFKTYRHNKL